MFKGYIFLQFYVFSTVVKSISEATQLEGKLGRNVKCTMQVASGKGASSFACHPPYPWSLHLWPTLNSQACTDLHLWCMDSLRFTTMSWGTWRLGSSLTCVTMLELSHYFNHSQANILHLDQQTRRVGPIWTLQLTSSGEETGTVPFFA